MNWLGKPRPTHPARARSSLTAGPLVLSLLLLGFALPSLGDEDFKAVDLVACNTGNVEIDTINVTSGDMEHRWTVLGWISVPPARMHEHYGRARR